MIVATRKRGGDIVQLPDIQEFPVIIKILKEEYVEDLLNGNLYMNNLKFFVDLEKDLGRQGVGDIRKNKYGRKETGI